MIKTPEGCPRGYTVCQPLSRIDVDEKDGFLCCGHLHKKARKLQQDRFRLCWKADVLDTMYDYDKRDLADNISVMSQALSADENREYNGLTEEWWNEVMP